MRTSIICFKLCREENDAGTEADAQSYVMPQVCLFSAWKVSVTYFLTYLTGLFLDNCKSLVAIICLSRLLMCSLLYLCLYLNLSVREVDDKY